MLLFVEMADEASVGAVESPLDGCEEFGVEVDFCDEVVFELAADFWALILAFRLAVY